MHKIYHYKYIYLAVGSLSLLSSFFLFLFGGWGGSAAEESVKRIIEISEESQIKVSAEKSPSYLEVSQNQEVSKKSPNIEVPQKSQNIEVSRKDLEVSIPAGGLITRNT